MNSELKPYLEEFGLSEYEIRAYLSLLELCSATMRELSEKSGVPYQKIYEVTKSLESKRLLKIIEGKPKRVKIIDPSISLPLYRDKIFTNLDKAINKIIEFWSKRRNGNFDRSIHVKGKKSVMRLVKDLVEKSNKIKVVYAYPPDWLIKLLRQFNGELVLITSDEKIDIPKFKVDNINSKFMLFDDYLLVTFNGDDEVILDSCKGCVIQANEHFELLYTKIKI